MMRKAILLGLIFFSINSFSQKKVNSIVSGKDNSTNGDYTYEANVEFRFESTGLLTDIKVYRKILNYKITSYTYKNTSATNVGVQFPIVKTKSSLVDAIVDIEFYKGQLSYTAQNLNCNGTAYLSKSQIADLLRVFNIDPNDKECTICDPIKEVNKLNIRAKNIRLNNLGYMDEFSEMNSKIEALLKEQKQSVNKSTEIAEIATTSEDKTLSISEESEEPLEKTNNTAKSSNESVYENNQRESSQDKAQREANEQLARNQQKYEQLERASKKLSQELDEQLENTFNSWAKRSEFNKTMNSLTKIESTSINSIIAEVKQKSRAIDNQYDQKKIDRRNEIANQGNYYAKQAKTQSELNLSNSITGLAQVLEQNSIEKQRREAQQELRQEQRNAEKELNERFVEKILPRFKQYFELAIKSVFADEEKYYTELYLYNECLIDNSSSILSGYDSCSEPRLKKPTGNPKPGATDFYNAYLRKKSSSDEYLNRAAIYQLELAINANPNNALWLYESTLVKEMDTYQKAAVLKKAHALDSSNEEIKNAFEAALKDLELLKEKERTYFKNHNARYPDFDWELHNGLKGITIGDHIFFVDKYGEEIFKIDNFEAPSLYSLDRLSSREFFNMHEHIQFGSNLVRFGELQNEKLMYGYRNRKGEIIVPANFPDAAQFSEGLAAVQDKNSKLWGYINEDGQLYIPFQFSESTHFSEGLAAISHPSYPYGAYINKKGQVAIEGKKNFIISEPFINGSSMVLTHLAGSYSWQSHENHYKYILPSGEFLIKDKFVNIYPFSKRGYAVVGSANRYYIIDRSGKKQHKKTFKAPPVFINGKAKVDTGTLLTGYYNYITIDETGKTIQE